jgi:hypothetical protein
MGKLYVFLYDKVLKRAFSDGRAFFVFNNLRVFNTAGWFDSRRPTITVA